MHTTTFTQPAPKKIGKIPLPFPLPLDIFRYFRYRSVTMEKPLCKLCGKRHWSRESCGRIVPVESDPVELISETLDELQARVDRVMAGSSPEEGEGRARKTGPGDCSGSPGVSDPERNKPSGAKDGIATRPAPLTPAEKQRAYRKRLRADPGRYSEYLKRDRERKRK